MTVGFVPGKAVICIWVNFHAPTGVEPLFTSTQWQESECAHRLEPKQVVSRSQGRLSVSMGKGKPVTTETPTSTSSPPSQTDPHGSMFPGGQCSKVTFGTGENRTCTFNPSRCFFRARRRRNIPFSVRGENGLSERQLPPKWSFKSRPLLTVVLTLWM